MSGVERKHLDGVLEGYVAQNPKLAELHGDEFVIKPRRLGPLVTAALVFTLLMMLLFFAVGLFMIVFGLFGNNVENRLSAVLIGLFLALFAGAIVFFVVVGRSSRGIVDLNTGDFKTKSIFGTKAVVNMANVDSYNRLDQRMQSNAGGATVNVVCQIQATVPGKRGPKTKNYQLAVFNKAQAFTDFEPVVNALIGYFHSHSDAPAAS